MELKDIIIDRMNKLNINNEELARRVGVAPSTTLRYIKGDITNIRRDKIKKLADALNIDVSYLMGWKEYRSENDAYTDNDLLEWFNKIQHNENNDAYQLLKIISQLADDQVRALLIMAKALNK